MKSAPKILLVDDEPGMLRYIKTLLEVDDYKVETATTGEEALQRVEKGLQPDLVLLDVLMPGIDGLQTLEQLRQMRPGVKVVMLSCVNDTKKVVHAMKLGALDYLTKPFQKAELDAVIDLSLGKGKQTYNGEVEELAEDVFFIAASAEMRKIRSQAALVANVDIPVLLLGESGTGKEVLARLIHKLSPRAHRTFLKVNCAAVPADLLESELFGYEPGAFTGATHAKPGKFELCNKGTILLDEIGEMPPLLQAKLLHVLQDQQFSRLGSRSVIKVDVRILAATNINIPEALATKRLREDLYYRLNAFTLHLPPLRDRKEDVPPLAEHFFTKYCRENEKFLDESNRSRLRFEPDAMQVLMDHAWPGNVRELENVVERAVVLASQTSVPVDVLPEHLLEARGLRIRRDESGRLAPDASLFEIVADFERHTIIEQLEKSDWSQTAAAEALRIPLSTLNQKIKRLNIEIRKKSGS